MFSVEEQFPVLSKLIRGEGQNAGRLHTTLSKELNQRLRSTDMVKCTEGTGSERDEVHTFLEARPHSSILKIMRAKEGIRRLGTVA